MKMKTMLCVMILCALLSSPLFAVDKTWNGAVDSYWNTDGNWTPSGKPGSSDDPNITIEDTIDIVNDATGGTLFIQQALSTDAVTVNHNESGKKLELSNDLNVSTGTATINILAGNVINVASQLKVGRDDGDDGELTCAGGILDVADQIEIGLYGTGKLTLNSTNITDYLGASNASKLRVAAPSFTDEFVSRGTLIMNGTSVIRTNEKDTYIGSFDHSAADAEGIVEMNNTSQIIVDGGDDSLWLSGKAGKGTLNMNDSSYIYIGGDLFSGARDNGDGIITMTGGTITVKNQVYMGSHDTGGYYAYGDDNRCRLTMSGNATINTGVTGTWGTFRFANEDDPTPLTPNVLTMSGNAFISVDNGTANMKIAGNKDAYAVVNISGTAEIKSQELQICNGGGGTDFTMDGGRLNVKDHLYVAKALASPADAGIVNITIDNNAIIDIQNKFRIGSPGAMVTIDFKDGDIDMPDADDDLTMPNTGPTGAGGYCKFTLGENDVTKNPEDAEFNLDGPMNQYGYYADPSTDYFDFLAGGILKVQQNKVPEQDIIDHIASGYFKTSYNQATLYTVAPAANEVYGVVYSSAGGGTRWDIEVGIVEGLDFGDAPDPLYETLLASNGARHIIADANNPFFDDPTLLGLDAPDPEPDGQPNVGATGDDNDPNDDEDGVILVPLTIGVAGPITFYVGGDDAGGDVSAWIDYNADGDWYDAGETLLSGASYAKGGPYVVMATAPAGSDGTTYVRFRITTSGALDPNGLAPDGEVEDHQVTIVSAGCIGTGHADYAQWNSLGQPPSWCNTRQCYGDASESNEPFGKGTVWVGAVDLGIMLDGWKVAYTGTSGEGNYGEAWIAADFTRSSEPFGKGTVRVGAVDLGILLANWKTSYGGETDCND